MAVSVRIATGIIHYFQSRRTARWRTLPGTAPATERGAGVDAYAAARLDMIGTLRKRYSLAALGKEK